MPINRGQNDQKTEDRRADHHVNGYTGHCNDQWLQPGTWKAQLPGTRNEQDDQKGTHQQDEVGQHQLRSTGTPSMESPRRHYTKHVLPVGQRDAVGFTGAQDAD